VTAEQAVLGGRFFVTSPLGSGDIAQSYDVRDLQGAHFLLETVEPRVAADPRAWALCQEQAHHADALRSGLFARLLEAGVDLALGPYLLREAVPGISLANRLTQEGPLSTQQALKLLGMLAAGLEEAHRTGLVHRGLGPWCVMVGKSLFLESVRVGELGLAILRATAPQPWPGPLGWMSAAQAQGDQVSPAMDIHALAMIAFFALTARPLLRTVASGTPDPVAVWAEMAAPPSASRRAAELGVTLPEAFDAVMMRAIAVQPASPFPSAVTLVQAMEDALRAPKKVFGKTLLLGQATLLSAPAPVDELEDGWPSNIPPEVAKSEPPAAPVSLAGVEVAGAASRHQSTASGLGSAQSPSTPAPAAPPPEAPIPALGQYPSAPPPEAPVPPLGQHPSAPPVSAQYPIAQYPGEPSISLPMRSRTGLWIGIGAVLLVGIVLAGGIGGYLFLRGAGPAPSDASASPAMSPASAAQTEVATPPVAPPSASAPPEAQPSAAVGPALATVTLACTPACRELDSISCDDKPQKLDDQDRLELEPGTHQCVLTKAGYLPQKLRLVELKPGATEKRSVVLARAAAAGANEPKRPCGTFINPCP
jgi:serine/threonine-protein kinase